MPSPAENLQLDDLLAEADWLRGLARHLAGSEDAADELVQETWLAALRRPPIDASQPRLWLAGVLRNLHRISLRKDGRRRQREQKCAVPEAAPCHEVARDRAFLQHRLADEIFRLDEQTRSVVVLRYFDRLSSAQISKQLNFSPEVVRQRLFRARKRLRDRLQQDYGNDWRNQCLAVVPGALAGSSIPLAVLIMNTKIKLIAGLALVVGIPLWMTWGELGNSAMPLQDSSTLKNAQVEAQLDGSEETARISLESKSEAESLPIIAPIEADLLLSGVVISTNGDAIADAKVTVLQPMNRQIPGAMDYWQAEDRILEEVVTQTDGQFQFALEHRKVYDVLVEANGFAQSRSLNLYAGEYLQITLEPSARVFGKVVDQVGRSPLEGVSVRLRPGPVSPGAPIRYETTTDSQGYYRLEDMPSGYYSLRVDSASHPEPGWAWMDFPVLKSGEEREFNMELAAGTVVSGRITHAETQTGIAAATVNMRISSPERAAIADMNGYFELIVPIGFDDSLRFRADGFGEFNLPVNKAPAEGVEVYVALRPARTAVGRVLDRQGQPISGARVLASARQRSVDFREQLEDVRTQTDGLGQFKLANLRMDLRHSLMITHESFATTVFDFPTEEWSTFQLDLHDLIMENPASIQGRVVDLSEKPVPGIWVLLSVEPTRRDDLSPSFAGNEGYRVAEGFGFGRTVARTDARGRYAFSNLPAGNYSLAAGAKGYANYAKRDLLLTEGIDAKNIDFLMDRGFSIKGIVVDANGNPVPSASVHVMKPNPGAFDTPLTYNLCKADGTFELNGLKPGNYRIEASSGFSTSRNLGNVGRPWTEVTLDNVPAGTLDLRIVLPEMEMVSGVVYGPDGKPLFGAVIRVVMDDGDSISAITSTDRNGKFSVVTIHGKQLDLSVHPPVWRSDGAYRPIYGDDGKLDTSYDVSVSAIEPGTEDLVIHLPKLPD